MAPASKGRLLRGAPQLAKRIFGDERKARALYTVMNEFPCLFWLGGLISDYETRSTRR